MSPLILGIDPGTRGGLVLLRGAQVLHQVLVRHGLHRPGGRPAYDPEAIAGTIRSWAPDHIFVERQWPRPGEGVSSSFTLGTGYGLWFGVAAGLGIPCTEVDPKTWQAGILAGAPGLNTKQRSIFVARSRLPDLDLYPLSCSVAQDGLADAACIALWGQVQLRRENLKTHISGKNIPETTGNTYFRQKYSRQGIVLEGRRK